MAKKHSMMGSAGYGTSHGCHDYGLRHGYADGDDVDHGIGHEDRHGVSEAWVANKVHSGGKKASVKRLGEFHGRMMAMRNRNTPFGNSRVAGKAQAAGRAATAASSMKMEHDRKTFDTASRKGHERARKW